MQESRLSSSRVVGVDMGGTNLQAAVCDEQLSILGRSYRPTRPEHGFAGVVDRLVDAIREACGEAGIQTAELDGVGVAAAGAIDFPRGVVLDSPNLGWRDVPLRDSLAEALDRPVTIENDVNAAAWAESRLGAGRERGDLLALWVGTGVGGGLVLNKRLHRGDFHTAGEIGHTVLFPEADKGRRSVEDWCSRTGMSRTIQLAAKEHPESPLIHAAGSETVRFHELAEAWTAGDPLAEQVIDRATSFLGLAIANWVTVLAMDTVVLGGGGMEVLGTPYLKRVRAAFESFVFPVRSRDCQIKMTELRENAGLLGAALLARDAGLTTH